MKARRTQCHSIKEKTEIKTYKTYEQTKKWYEQMSPRRRL